MSKSNTLTLSFCTLASSRIYVSVRRPWMNDIDGCPIAPKVARQSFR